MNNIWPLDNKEKTAETFKQTDEDYREWWKKMRIKDALITKQINAEKNGR